MILIMQMNCQAVSIQWIGVYFLTGEEQKWLSEHGAIKIGYLINDGGVSTLDTETGKVSGLITDYIQLAQNCLEGCKKGCL